MTITLTIDATVQSTVIQNVALQYGWTSVTDIQARDLLAAKIATEVRKAAIAGELIRQRNLETASLTAQADTKITAAGA
jgi:hypothetical protein